MKMNLINQTTSHPLGVVVWDKTKNYIIMLKLILFHLS